MQVPYLRKKKAERRVPPTTLPGPSTARLTLTWFIDACCCFAGWRMARKSDSCLTPCIKGERRLRNTMICRRSDSVKLGDLQAGRSFRIVPGASDVEGACARASLPHRAGELVPQSQSAGHWPTTGSLRQRPGNSSSTCRPGADDAGSLPRFQGGRLRDG